MGDHWTQRVSHLVSADQSVAELEGLTGTAERLEALFHSSHIYTFQCVGVFEAC